MDMIEKIKLNTAYGMFANYPYRNVLKETIKIDLTGRIVKATITLSDKELEYIKNDELALKEVIEKRGKPNGNFNKR